MSLCQGEGFPSSLNTGADGKSCAQSFLRVLTNHLQFLCPRVFYLFSSWFIQQALPLHKHSRSGVHFVVWVTIQCCCTYSVVQISSALASGSLSEDTFVCLFLTHSRYLFSCNSITFLVTRRCFRLISCISSITDFSRKPFTRQEN